MDDKVLRETRRELKKKTCQLSGLLFLGRATACSNEISNRKENSLQIRKDRFTDAASKSHEKKPKSQRIAFLEMWCRGRENWGA